jgi:hypothetical protein
MKMIHEHSFRGLLHRATHRVPGVPAHACRPAGHQSTVVHGRASRRGGVAAQSSLNHEFNHSSTRPPRFMPAWQRRVAAFFGRAL